MANFSSGQGIAYMHESLYAATGKRLTYVLNVAARAMTKHALNVHAGHDDYHAVDHDCVDDRADDDRAGGDR